MSFSWPFALLTLLLVPALFGVLWWTRRNRRRSAIRLSSVALVRASVQGTSKWRRRIPVALLAVGMLVIGVGIARPQASVDVPSSSATMILAIDVSGSMCSTDVEPNRLVAAQAAATKFVEAQDDGTQIGIVAFSSIAGLVVAPTNDHDDLLAAIAGLTTSRGTAIGLAILASIDAIAEINPDVAATGVAIDTSDASTTVEDYQPETIVVLTDGSNSTGVDPVTAAAEAAARGLRVYTIGFGTTTPAPSVCTADQVTDGMTEQGQQGGRGGGGGEQTIDEETLGVVADATGGEYFRAEDAAQLNDVLQDLPSTISVTKQDVEISAWFVLPGALLVAGAFVLSAWWNRTR